MSKKKPYSRVENAKLLRKEQMSYDSLFRTLKKKNIEIQPWQTRLFAETHELTERIIRLSDFLWVKETKDSPALYSKEAETLGRKYCQLLVRQVKAMQDYRGILEKRLELVVLAKEANADHRKQRGRTAPNRALKNGGAK